jgi:cytochrome c peroxidase
LHFYQLSIAAPKPQPGRDFDPSAAKRGDELFSGKARCNNCHVEPLWTEPGWNPHKPSEVCVDAFQADRAPADAFAGSGYRTSPLAGIFTHQKGGFYHDGRFPTLRAVIDH